MSAIERDREIAAKATKMLAYAERMLEDHEAIRGEMVLREMVEIIDCDDPREEDFLLMFIAIVRRQPKYDALVDAVRDGCHEDCATLADEPFHSPACEVGKAIRALDREAP